MCELTECKLHIPNEIRLKVHFSHIRKWGGFILLILRTINSVSPDYLAHIIGLLSMLSLIMNKRDMSNSPTSLTFCSKWFAIVLELIRPGTCTSFRIRPNIRAALLRTEHRIMQMRVKHDSMGSSSSSCML